MNYEFIELLLIQILIIESIIISLYLLNYVTISMYNLNALHQIAVADCVAKNIAANTTVCLV
jgi:hypothetical protein